LWSLDDLAMAIELLWVPKRDARLMRAVALKAAKDRIDGGESCGYPDFWAWCAAKFPDRSARDINRLLEIANAPDPESGIARVAGARGGADRAIPGPAGVSGGSIHALFRGNTQCPGETRSGLTSEL
jgi:hypothetical protein